MHCDTYSIYAGTNNSILESEAIIQLIHLQSTDAGASCYDTEVTNNEQYSL